MDVRGGGNEDVFLRFVPLTLEVAMEISDDLSIQSRRNSGRAWLEIKTKWRLGSWSKQRCGRVTLGYMCWKERNNTLDSWENTASGKALITV